MDCPTSAGHDTAEAYVAGTLPDDEQEAFERHFYGCAACLAQVQTLQDVRDRLASVPPVPRAADPRWQAAPWLGLALAAGVMAVGGWWWQHGGLRPSPAPTPSAAPPSAAEPALEAPGRRSVLARLATVVPPRYVPPTVPGQTPAAGSADEAMAHYAAGRYDRAAGALQVLSDARPTDPGLAFFWGISELVIGHTDAAREGLTRAIAAGAPPYADEARFYLAKAYLADDAVDLARLELQYAVSRDAGPEGEAQRILAALDRLPD